MQKLQTSIFRLLFWLPLALLGSITVHAEDNDKELTAFLNEFKKCNFMFESQLKRDQEKAVQTLNAAINILGSPKQEHSDLQEKWFRSYSVATSSEIKTTFELAKSNLLRMNWLCGRPGLANIGHGNLRYFGDSVLASVYNADPTRTVYILPRYFDDKSYRGDSAGWDGSHVLIHEALHFRYPGAGLVDVAIKVPIGDSIEERIAYSKEDSTNVANIDSYAAKKNVNNYIFFLVDLNSLNAELNSK